MTYTVTTGDNMNDELTFKELMEPEEVKDKPLEEGVKLAAHDLFLRLQGSFSPPAYITLEEVRDATGFDGVRTADALAISLYRSRGKAVWGFEMKVSRNDWLKELKQPEKAESIMRYCNYWALVVPSESIVKVGELPATWGMYVAQKNRLKCVVPCPKLDPMPMSLTFLTAIAYAIQHRQDKLDSAALTAARDEGYKQGVDRSGSGFWEKEHKELQESVDAFEKASGLNIRRGWQKPEKVGAIVKLLLQGEAPLKRILDTAKYNLSKTEDLKIEIEKQIKVLESAMAGAPQPTDEED
jgi:hypothetical protein